MDKKSLGFLTPSGLIAAMLTILVVVAVGWLRGGILFSPGPLHAKTGAPLGGVTSHAELGGRCSTCHTAFWDQAGMADRCLACHTAIAAQLQDPAATHAIFQTADPGLVCWACHPDHKGRDASTTILESLNFPHEALGYSLATHQLKDDDTPFSCADCHAGTYAADYDQAICTTCHRQSQPDVMHNHVQAYGEDCLACHDGVDSYGSAFDHARVPFQLTGLHAGLDCGQCHTGARTIADLKQTPQDCFSCHAKDDAHQGQLGAACEVCHTTAGWLPAAFDHDATSFKLTGLHATAPCTGCHVNAILKGTPVDCNSCHAGEDVHQGQLGAACESCHTPAGWLPSTFDHNISSFKLDGKHAEVSCTGCHVNAIFKGTPADCYSCHARDDKHAGLYGTACNACHTTNGWLPATFDHRSFPLTAGHAGLACTRCHTGGVFTGLSTACAFCHADPPFHAGLFAGTACNACHSTQAWIPASYNGPHPGGCDGNCISHEGASCRDCHTSNLATATCLKCHDSNNPEDGGGGGGGGDDD